MLKIVREDLYALVMLNITSYKYVLMAFLPVAFLAVAGCKGLQKPGEFVESLRNPTSFPEYFLPEIKNIDEIINEHGLAEDENVKVIPIGNDKSSSIYILQIRENAEMDAHYHKSHDTIVYFKKGSGILELDGTRHSVQEGMLAVIPRLSGHRYINTGEVTNVAVLIFSPPFDSKDIIVFKESAGIRKKKKNIYDKAMEKSRKELKKEEGGDRGWLGLRKKDDGEDPGREKEGQTGDVIEEEQKILVLTEEGKQKIREARAKVKKEEKAIIDRIILDEKLKVLQELKDDGSISQEEFEAKKTEITSKSGLKD